MGAERSPSLTTARCVLRPVVPTDAGALRDLWCAPGVRRFLWDDEIVSLEATHAAIEQSRRMFEEQALGLWGAWSGDPAALIGFAGIWPFRDPPELELLYGVAEQRWGCGYASELASAVLGYCFDSRKMPAVRASTDVANSASVRVLEKLGFQCVGRSDAGPATVFYELRAPGVVWLTDHRSAPDGNDDPRPTGRRDLPPDGRGCGAALCRRMRVGQE